MTEIQSLALFGMFFALFIEQGAIYQKDGVVILLALGILIACGTILYLSSD